MGSHKVGMPTSEPRGSEEQPTIHHHESKVISTTCSNDECFEKNFTGPLISLQRNKCHHSRHRTLDDHHEHQHQRLHTRHVARRGYNVSTAEKTPTPQSLLAGSTADQPELVHSLSLSSVGSSSAAISFEHSRLSSMPKSSTNSNREDVSQEYVPDKTDMLHCGLTSRTRRVHSSSSSSRRQSSSTNMNVEGNNNTHSRQVNLSTASRNSWRHSAIRSLGVKSDPNIGATRSTRPEMDRTYSGSRLLRTSYGTARSTGELNDDQGKSHLTTAPGLAINRPGRRTNSPQDQIDKHNERTSPAFSYSNSSAALLETIPVQTMDTCNNDSPCPLLSCQSMSDHQPENQHHLMDQLATSNAIVANETTVVSESSQGTETNEPLGNIPHSTATLDSCCGPSHPPCLRALPVVTRMEGNEEGSRCSSPRPPTLPNPPEHQGLVDRSSGCWSSPDTERQHFSKTFQINSPHPVFENESRCGHPENQEPEKLHRTIIVNAKPPMSPYLDHKPNDQSPMDQSPLWTAGIIGEDQQFTNLELCDGVPSLPCQSLCGQRESTYSVGEPRPIEVRIISNNRLGLQILPPQTHQGPTLNIITMLDERQVVITTDFHSGIQQQSLTSESNLAHPLNKKQSKGDFDSLPVSGTAEIACCTESEPSSSRHQSQHGDNRQHTDYGFTSQSTSQVHTLDTGRIGDSTGPPLRCKHCDQFCLGLQNGSSAHSVVRTTSDSEPVSKVTRKVMHVEGCMERHEDSRHLHAKRLSARGRATCCRETLNGHPGNRKNNELYSVSNSVKVCEMSEVETSELHDALRPTHSYQTKDELGSTFDKPKFQRLPHTGEGYRDRLDHMDDLRKQERLTSDPDATANNYNSSSVPYRQKPSIKTRGQEHTVPSVMTSEESALPRCQSNSDRLLLPGQCPQGETGCRHQQEQPRFYHHHRSNYHTFQGETRAMKHSPSTRTSKTDTLNETPIWQGSDRSESGPNLLGNQGISRTQSEKQTMGCSPLPDDKLRISFTAHPSWYQQSPDRCTGVSNRTAVSKRDADKNFVDKDERWLAMDDVDFASVHIQTGQETGRIPKVVYVICSDGGALEYLGRTPTNSQRRQSVSSKHENMTNQSPPRRDLPDRKIMSAAQSQRRRVSGTIARFCFELASRSKRCMGMVAKKQNNERGAHAYRRASVSSFSSDWASASGRFQRQHNGSKPRRRSMGNPSISWGEIWSS